MKTRQIFYASCNLQTHVLGLIYGASPDEQKRACIHYIAEHFPNEEAHEMNTASQSFESALEDFKPSTILVVYNMQVLFRLSIAENPIDYLSKKGIKVIVVMNDGDSQIDFPDLATISLDNVNRPSSPILRPYIDESLSSWLARAMYRPQWKCEVERRFRQLNLSRPKGHSEDDLGTGNDE